VRTSEELFHLIKGGKDNMATVRDILARKGSQVFTIGKEATVLQAAQLMNEHKIGALVVTEGGQVIGLFTERDILRRVVGEQREPARTQVGDTMTTELICCTPETTIDEARLTMKDRRIRHLPLVDEDRRLQGLISIGDLNAYDATSQEETIYLLREYIYGRV
jgi:CBS domain-containing protein